MKEKNTKRKKKCKKRERKQRNNHGMEEANRGLREAQKEVEVEVVTNDHVLKEEWQIDKQKDMLKIQTDRQIDGKNCRLIRRQTDS